MLFDYVIFEMMVYCDEIFGLVFCVVCVCIYDDVVKFINVN